MTKNMGATDRLLRIAAAILLALLAVTNVVSGNLAVLFYILALVFTATSLAGFCPLYPILGINTCGRQIKS